MHPNTPSGGDLVKGRSRCRGPRRVHSGTASAAPSRYRRVQRVQQGCKRRRINRHVDVAQWVGRRKVPVTEPVAIKAFGRVRFARAPVHKRVHPRRDGNVDIHVAPPAVPWWHRQHHCAAWGHERHVGRALAVRRHEHGRVLKQLDLLRERDPLERDVAHPPAWSAGRGELLCGAAQLGKVGKPPRVRAPDK